MVSSLAFAAAHIEPAHAVLVLPLGLMFGLLRYVSGVPLLEATMLKSRGDLFRDYQRRVSVFFPFPPKRA